MLSTTISEVVRRARLRYLGHLLRMDVVRQPVKVFEMDVVRQPVKVFEMAENSKQGGNPEEPRRKVSCIVSKRIFVTGALI